MQLTLGKSARWRRVLVQIGPGLVVMLADTEAGSVITAAQSGAQWGYRLLLLQALLVPLLFMAQELSGRLALSTGLGHVELLRRRAGRSVATLAVLVLVVSCFGALVTEMAGMVGIGQMFGLHPGQTVAGLVVLILVMVATGAYQTVERMVIVLGLFELAFVVVAWRAQPQWAQITAQIADLPLHQGSYLYLLAANLGTCIMPWAIVYQQSALIDKGLGPAHMKVMRVDTLTGALLCQFITASVLVAAAASFGAHQPAAAFETVGQLSQAFSAVLGGTWGHLIFALGFSGGALVATVVVCLTAAWAIGELTGAHHSLEQHPLEAPWFYAAFALMLLLAAALVLSGVGLVHLSITTGVLNALLLPAALGSLFWLARNEPAEPHRLRGAYAVVVGAAFALTSLVGVVAGLAGALD